MGITGSGGARTLAGDAKKAKRMEDHQRSVGAHHVRSTGDSRRGSEAPAIDSRHIEVAIGSLNEGVGIPTCLVDEGMKELERDLRLHGWDPQRRAPQCIAPCGA